MIEIDYRDKRPIYEQIKEKLKNLIISGAIKENEKIPSVRELAAETAINPNTIQKALAELDRRGLITSVPAKGSFIATNALNVLFASGMNNLQKLKEDIEKLKLAGVDKQQIREIIDEVYVND